MTAQFDLALATCTQKIGRKIQLSHPNAKTVALALGLALVGSFEVLSKLPWHWLVVPYGVW